MAKKSSKQPKPEGEEPKEPTAEQLKKAAEEMLGGPFAVEPDPTAAILDQIKAAPDAFDPEMFDVTGIEVPAALAGAPLPTGAKLKDPTDLLANPPEITGCYAAKVPAFSEGVRTQVTSVLQKFWPAAYVEYRKLKYPVPGVEPTLEQRKAAYEWAWRAFLALTYTKSNAK